MRSDRTTAMVFGRHTPANLLANNRAWAARATHLRGLGASVDRAEAVRLAYGGALGRLDAKGAPEA